jgi:hypothetical protein
MMLTLIKDAVQATRLPRLKIDLMRREAKSNDPFYLNLVEEFYRESTAAHRRYRVISSFATGIAVCDLRNDSKPYLNRIEASGKRNVKKAERLGYQFATLDYNAHLKEIAEIRRSTDTRQGAVSTEFLNSEVRPVANPQPLNDFHRYDYFGVFREEKLYAYAGCFLAGEICLLEHIYGHAAHQGDGIVPLLFAGIASHLSQIPHLRYYCYGSTFGAGKSMRRFKKKFLFHPHNITWELG